ncbi:hypothetical protein A2T98_07785 [Nodularia spumigena CENA596]|uniref:Uncharacterized protein n=3 Tax=Cyanobacteriota TaxID=1117 RepID=A0A166K033_NODSP|nr:hypothetical protein A2T98_07785 [Nodularia spumigena CENA596]
MAKPTLYPYGGHSVVVHITSKINKMNNKEQTSTNPQQLNCNKMPLFEPVNLEQQDSVVGGFLSSLILNVFPDTLIPGRAEAVAIANQAAETALQVAAEAESRGFSIQFLFSFLI